MRDRHEPVQRFDQIWKGWSDRLPLDSRVDQHRQERARFLRALESATRQMPVPRLLEVGCGSAIDLCLLAKRAPGLAAVGLDLSPLGLEAARTFARHLDIRLPLCCGNVFELPFQGNCFGLVFSQGLLEHFRDPLPAMAEQARVLAPGGFLIVSVPQTVTGYTAWKRWAIWRGTWPWGWEGQFTARGLTALGRSQNLRLVRVFGYQYWLSWLEPSWVLRDLWGKLHRRNPLAARPPFLQIARTYDRLWEWIECRHGHRFLQNVVAVFQKPTVVR